MARVVLMCAIILLVCGCFSKKTKQEKNCGAGKTVDKILSIEGCYISVCIPSHDKTYNYIRKYKMSAAACCTKGKDSNKLYFRKRLFKAFVRKLKAFCYPKSDAKLKNGYLYVLKEDDYVGFCLNGTTTELRLEGKAEPPPGVAFNGLYNFYNFNLKKGWHFA